MRVTGYVSQEDAKKLKNNKELESLCVWSYWSTYREFKITATIKKIDKRPFGQKIKEFWNKFIERLKL